MRILVDTQSWLWMIRSPDRLSTNTLALLEDGATELLFSAAAVWEIAIKYAVGKLPLPDPPEIFVPARLERSGVAPLRIEHAHALRAAALPQHHKDPFDRMMVAQAQLEELSFLTADRMIGEYDVPIVWAN